MKILYILLLVSLVEIQSKALHPGPRALSQIQALQSGKRIMISFLPEPAVTGQGIQKDLTSKEHKGLRHEENIRDPRVYIPIYEPLEEDMFSEISNFKQEERKTETENQFRKFEYHDNLRLQHATLQKLQLQVPDQWNQDEPETQRVAYDSNSEKGQKGDVHKEFKQKWNRILELNQKQIKALSQQATRIQKSEEHIQLEKPLLQLLYATKYNDQKNAINIEKLIRERHQDELDKQSALVQAEAIANAPPILIHKEVIITKHRPAHVL